MAELLFQHVLPKQIMLLKTDVFDVQQNAKKCQKRSIGPKTDLFGQKQTGRGRSEAKTAGVKKFLSFIWTLVVKKENEQMKPTHHLHHWDVGLHQTRHS